MRDLSVVELEMIVGGYSQFDADMAAGYSSSATYNADGSYSLDVSQQEYAANAGAAADNGWNVEVGGSWGPNGPTVSVKASKKC